MRKFFAFTLAETLIVMGIIGIVSALTLPNLNSSTGEKEKIAKVKKIYQNFEDALGRATAVYGPVDEWFVNDSTTTAQTTRFGDRVSEFMKISKNCGAKTNTSCFKNANINGLHGSSGFNPENNSCYKIILADGTSACMMTYAIYIDIDGVNKGKHQFGTDIFYLGVKDGSMSTDTTNTITFDRALENLSKDSGVDATWWIMNFDNMDYLKLDTSGKCPNGTTPTEQNPRCK